MVHKPQIFCFLFSLLTVKSIWHTDLSMLTFTNLVIALNIDRSLLSITKVGLI